MRILLLKIWRSFPLWLRIQLARVIVPLFHVFAAAFIVDSENRVLLVKTTYNRLHPWGLPGGSLNYGESPEDAVVREVMEETSFEVAVDKFIFAKNLIPDRVGLFYACRITGGEFRPSDEVSECGYFSLDALPDVHPVDAILIKIIHEKVKNELA